MQIQFQFVVDEAARYAAFVEQPDKLYHFVNELPENVIQQVFGECNDFEENFQHLNLMRVQIAHLLLNGTKISERSIEKITQKICEKDKKYFSHLPDKVLQQLVHYKLIDNYSIYSYLKETWNVFHVFVYRDEIKKKVQLYLKQISEQVIKDLQLSDYKSTWTDFAGEMGGLHRSFSTSTKCEIELSPSETITGEFYKCRLKLSEDSNIRLFKNALLFGNQSELVEHTNSYEQSIQILQNLKPKLFQLNRMCANQAEEREILLSEDDEIKPYVFAADPDKPFIAEADFLQAVELLKRKKNVILQGSPGVGKTFVARKLAYQIMGEQNDAQIEMVQFHQSYAYEDFVQGLRPTSDGGGFKLQNGAFYDFCRAAKAEPERQFFFIIDEINRGNLSKIFGELMMLVEADKRSPKYALKLTYAEPDAERFFVPPNVFIIGTMNTADRSLAIVDYALRRRFAFVKLEPEFGAPFREFLAQRNVSSDLIEDLCRALNQTNRKICDDVNLGNGFQIGHSFFCQKNRDDDERAWLAQIVDFEIRPLLEELWFDDAAKVRDAIALFKF